MGHDKHEHLSLSRYKAECIDRLDVMQEEVQYTLTPLTERSLLAIALRRIPWMSRFYSPVRPAPDPAHGVREKSEQITQEIAEQIAQEIAEQKARDAAARAAQVTEDMRGAGGAVTTIGEQINTISPSDANKAISGGFHFGTIALSALDFLRIPAMYIAAYILDEEIPLSLNNNARWLYSGVLLGLTLTAFFVPGAAPIIGFVGAGLALADATYTLITALKERSRLGKERKQLKAEIAEAEEDMAVLQEHARYLEGLLNGAKDREQIVRIAKQIDLLQEQYDQQKQKLHALKNRELHVEQKIKNMGIMHIVDRVVGFSLSLISGVALVLAVVFPPLGIAMGAVLLVTALAGAAYTLGRIIAPIVAPYLKSFGEWVASKFTSGSEKLTVESNRLVHESTVDMFNGLQITPEHLKSSQMDKEVQVVHSTDAVPTRQIDSRGLGAENSSSVVQSSPSPASPASARQPVTQGMLVLEDDEDMGDHPAP